MKDFLDTAKIVATESAIFLWVCLCLGTMVAGAVTLLMLGVAILIKAGIVVGCAYYFMLFFLFEFACSWLKIRD